ncbi:hydro-lyase, Fe-S type, tartrate/fumarate subfamily, beta subunit [Hydrogenobacter thermophilus TK-6]|uniref:Fumarate hydratase beta subunit n=1 Tax=Hydrogenobacter thermophilus (strain DSM 6534 / IAM 12695 / TK-6) TaxID=608538 RepID=D3DG16_HYDTT|nr:Fe-S-containing hydro-lyase [Hydrogenobacter thermophilus]ADO44703.1 hydro-lyase, Fe-S type, tartrate/fumarate subfamily, beta subunit [Hydrogenobacter thermophilus TK-6]BAI68768.1 fumarate hydratase beta subunit [Hydrogenobacter thermophilus TK-6]
MEKRIFTPLTDETIESLKAGDRVLLTGYIYTARDAAHKRMVEALNRGEAPPFDMKGQVIYYVGPTPPKPGQVIGSAGPTTAIRMDKYVEPLLKLGLKGMIGKGYRSQLVKDLLIKYKAVYFAAVGGVAVLLSKSIKSSEVIAYEDLGTEAIRRLYVEDFPVIVANDIYGGDVFEEGRKKFAQIDP